MTPSKKLPSVSFSEIDAYRQCPHMWWLRYRERWTPPKLSLPLERGQLWHEILAQHYRTGKVEDALFRDEESGAQTEAQATCDWLYPHYVKKWWKEDAKQKTLAVEQRLNHAVPGHPFRISGVIDLVVRENRFLWLEDHKTHAQMPKERLLEILDQMPMYCWLLRQLGKPVHGVIYNVARTYRFADPNRAPEFERFYLHFSDAHLDEVVREVALTVERMREHANRMEAERNTGEHCLFRCDFTESCLASRKGADEDRFMRDKGFTQEAY